MKYGGYTRGLTWRVAGWSVEEAGGIPSGAVKCVDSRRKPRGEGGLLDDA